jgi:hypothetical protein
MLERSRSLLLRLLVVSCAAVALGIPASASASTPSPGWKIFTRVAPTNLPPGGSGEINVFVYNVGAGTGRYPTVTDVLPAGVTATSALLVVDTEERSGLGGGGGSLGECTVAIGLVSCTAADVPPGSIMDVQIPVTVGSPGMVDEEIVNQATATGGGALGPASEAKHIRVTSDAPGFGFSGFDLWASNPDGTIDTQAGSHPYELTVVYSVNSTGLGNQQEDVSVAQTRDLVVNLPPGLIGNPTAVPRCTRKQFDGELSQEQGGNSETTSCPPSTQIGLDQASISGFGISFKVYNLVPPPGVAAQFGFNFSGVPVFLDAGVRTGGPTPLSSDYGISEHVDNVPERQIVFNATTIWGVPGEEVHTPQREHERSGAGLTPFLTLPTSCEGPQEYSIETLNTWEGGENTARRSVLTNNSLETPVGFTGCNHLGFAPTVSVTPDTSYGDTPAGMTVDVKAPQHGLATAEGFSTSNIKDTTVALPEGVAINPGQAAGLVACQPDQDGVGTEGPASCPEASKVGTVEIETPLLADNLKGNVYLLPADPPSLDLLVAASGDGVNIKLIGHVHLDETTGRITTTFEATPAVPFNDLKLAFSGGPQAALTTPPTCGTYETTSDFTPWSTPLVQDAFPVSSFAIERGPGGSSCSDPLPFQPVMTAGSTTDQAGGFTSFSLLLQHGDGQQRIGSLQFKTPEGLLGMISRVPLCQEPQAAQGTCSEASQIGHTVVNAGPGPDPLVVPEPGQPPAPIYLTGAYKGAPYGLSIVVPVHAGPFDLGTIVVRGRIEVDQHTAQLTITTDPLPTIIKGIPADLRAINAVIDRPGFMFNPTSCAPMSFAGTAFSTDGRTAAIATPFQVGSCRALTFKPNFQVSTPAKISRVDGTGIDAKIIYPTGVLGHNQASSQTNIESVKVELPKQLPSRLSTLQKACAAKVFEANPAACPAPSVVGHVMAITPVLPVPLTGPAYFVSHGGEAFPSLILVLQGYGVTVDVVGSTFISKAGITSSTFKQIPDVPITLFELVLPAGPFSALTANKSPCGSTLKMPTDFIAQDGAIRDQSTTVTVTGCPKARKAAHKKLKHKQAKTKGKSETGAGHGKGARRHG